jgi:hypothetical protein
MIDEALSASAGVRFVRKRQEDKTPYDTRIVLDGVVPTRAGSWHDLLNACVWATFPKTKLAIHRRQHALVVPGAPRRTPEQDAIAMVDEGGILLLQGAEALVVGHAIFESFVEGWPTPRAAGIELGDVAAEGVDAAAASFLSDRGRLRSTSELLRIELDRQALSRAEHERCQSP